MHSELNYGEYFPDCVQYEYIQYIQYIRLHLTFRRPTDPFNNKIHYYYDYHLEHYVCMDLLSRTISQLKDHFDDDDRV